MKTMKVIEIHTAEEIAAEVERLRPEITQLLLDGAIRPGCIEDDLKTAAYNRLTEKKWKLI
jgi:hypothetical protein